MHLRVKPDDTDIGYVLLPLHKMHLYRADGSDGGIGTVRMFMIIAILILSYCMYQLCKSFYCPFYAACKRSKPS